MSDALRNRIDGQITRVNRRGKHLFCFDGNNLSKTGRSECVSIEFGAQRYTGELVAIGPTRAILQISPIGIGHGIAPAASMN